MVRDAAGKARSDDVAYEFLAFKLASETYALPLAGVREILKPPRITRVPRASHDDPRHRLGARSRHHGDRSAPSPARAPRRPLDKNTRVLLVDAGNEMLGLLVDAVLQVYRLSEDEIELASAVGGDMNEYVMGIGRPRAVRTLGRSVEPGSRRSERHPHPARTRSRCCRR